MVSGNLSYHLSSRPSWTRDLKEKSIENNDDGGVIYTGNPEILKRFVLENLELLNQ